MTESPGEGVGVAICSNLSSQSITFREELALEIASVFLDR